MRRSGFICSVIAIVLVACGNQDGDGGTTTASPPTTTAPQATTTAPQPTTTAPPTTTVTSVTTDGGGYPWVVEQRSPTSPILPALDRIEYGTGDTYQVPCPGCSQEVDEGEIVSHGQGTLQCDHPVDYIGNHLIVLDPREAFVDFFAELGGEATDITPVLAVEGEEAYVAPAAYRLFEINMDPIDALVEIEAADIGGEFEVSPNYVFHPSPKWKGTPGDAKTQADPLGQVPSPLFDQGVGVLVVDVFGSSDPLIGGHGEFISHLIERLTGATPVERDVQFSGQPANDTWSVVAAINSGVMTGQVGVVNLSIGTHPCAVVVDPETTIFSPPDLLLAELTRLRDDFGVTFVAAAGNDGHEPADPLFYPAGYADTENFVTSVGALGWSEEDVWYAADFTNIFDFNVWAPGVAVVSEIDASAYAWSGTSFAAPHVSACVAAGQC